MTVTYRPAVAVARIAEQLIPKHHDHLDDVRIEYVFRSETAKSKGRDVWGTARKKGGLDAYLAQEGEPIEAASGDLDFFVIEISEPVWAILDAGQRKALVDHELCHCRTDLDEKTGDLTLKVVSHDVEEFRAVVERHGIWRPDLAAFATSLPERQRTIEDGLTDGDGPDDLDAAAGGERIPEPVG